MNKNITYLVLSLVALFAGYFYLNVRLSNANKSNTAAPAAAPIVPGESAPGAAQPSGVAAPVVPLAAGGAVTSAPDAAVPTPVPLAVASPEDLRIELPYGRVNVSAKGGCLGEVTLQNYKESLKSTDPAEALASFALCKAYGVRLGGADLREADVGVERIGPKKVRLTQRAGTLEIVRTWDFEGKDYTAQFELEVSNRGATPTNTTLGIELGAASEHGKSSGMFASHANEFRGIAFYNDEKVVREHLKFESAPAREEIFRRNAFVPGWVGTDSIYFLSALLPVSREPYDLSILRTGFNIQKAAGSEDVRTVYEAWLDAPVSLAPGQSKAFSYKAYIGPKQRDLLALSYPGAHLDDSIDLGFFRIVSLPMYHALAWLHALVGNWGVAIILLTLAIKLLFLPLQMKAYVSGRKMQKIQPLMNSVREQYKDDKVKQQQEIMALMSRQKVNPASGCLPILPQIPVFFGLNSVLTHTFELRHAPLGLWLQDLSARDPWFITPVLMAGLMFAQQKLTPMPSMEPAQQRMMQFLPLVFAVFMLSYPSGLVVYIITNSVVSLIQQQWMMRRYKHL